MISPRFMMPRLEKAKLGKCQVQTCLHGYRGQKVEILTKLLNLFLDIVRKEEISKLWLWYTLLKESCFPLTSGENYAQMYRVTKLFLCQLYKALYFTNYLL